MSKLKYFDGTNWNEVNGNIVGDTLPIGSIVPYGSSTAPTNWLVCDGSAVSRTTYSELFAVIRTSYGAGDGSTTFNLPNLKGRVAVGQDTSDTSFDTIGETGGSKTDDLSKAYALVGRSTSNLNSISYKNKGQYSGTFDRTLANGSGIDGTSVSIQDTSALGGSVSTLQPYQVVCYIIKAKQSAGVVANVSNAYSTSQSDTYSCDYINDCETYSTSEVKTNKTWIDGKPIYRKVLSFPNGTGSTSEVAYNLSDYGITNVSTIFMVHPSYYSNAGTYYPFTFYDGNRFTIALSTTQMKVILGYSSISTSPFIVTLEYTKTTD